MSSFFLVFVERLLYVRVSYVVGVRFTSDRREEEILDS